MVIVPAGEFMMGSEGGRDSEKPVHKVTIARPFAVGRYAVTFAEWDAFVAAGGIKHRPKDEGWGRGRRPVINVSWGDAIEFVAWLSKRTGKTYRLLSEAEWEYAARAGSATETRAGKDKNTRESGSQWSGKQTAPVGSFKPNAFGLYEMLGNVREWTEDSWHENYENAPSDGSPRAGATHMLRVVRGGSWVDVPRFARSAFRGRCITTGRLNVLGFRVARTL
ncbi:MAG: formylglycine-generating enzyme family protein [Alphaproteobacteria bacterium]|nr:formylglycine-generating enzyme family protein [Alphaproteobacteria bacterium]